MAEFPLTIGFRHLLVEEMKNIIDFFSKIRDDDDPGMEDFRTAMVKIQKAYHPLNRGEDRPEYFARATRCAYIHKYASIHAAIIGEVILQLPAIEKMRIFGSDSDEMNICSLGGGCFSEVIGVLAAVSRSHDLPVKNYKFTSIDIEPSWQTTHDGVIRLLTNGNYGNLGNFYLHHARSTFVTDNLLNPRDTTLGIMNSSDMIIMMKFVSELMPADVPRLLLMVFQSMKPNAVLLFVDNSAGLSLKMVEDVFRIFFLQNQLEYIINRNGNFENDMFNKEKYGFRSLYKDESSVTILMIRKRQ